jgi:hypothetical protein
MQVTGALRCCAVIAQQENGQPFRVIPCVGFKLYAAAAESFCFAFHQSQLFVILGMQ